MYSIQTTMVVMSLLSVSAQKQPSCFEIKGLSQEMAVMV